MKSVYPLDEILGGRVAVRVVRQLCLFATKEFTGRELGRIAGVSHSKAIGALNLLHAHGLVERRSLGNSQLWKLQKGHILAPRLRSLFRFEAEIGESLAATLRAGLERLPAVRHAVVFGSTARAEAEPESDVDLLVVVGTRQEKDELLEGLGGLRQEIWKRFGSHLRPVVYTASEWKKKKSLALGKNIEREGVPVLGTRA